MSAESGVRKYRVRKGASVLSLDISYIERGFRARLCIRLILWVIESEARRGVRATVCSLTVENVHIRKKKKKRLLLFS